MILTITEAELASASGSCDEEETMNYKLMLSCSNRMMVLSLILFVGSLFCAFVLPLQSFALTIAFHLANIVLATLFKFSYIARLIAQKELGLTLR